MNNSAEGVSRNPISFQAMGTPATSPDTGICRVIDFVALTSLHGTRGSLARQAKPMAAGVSAAAHEALVHEVNSLRETLGQNLHA